MKKLSSNIQKRLIPLFLIIAVIIAGFSLILIQHHSFEVQEKDLEKKMTNATTRMALGELVVSNLRKVRANFYLAIIERHAPSQILSIKAGLSTIAEIHTLLNILDQGGTFSRTLQLNLTAQDAAELSTIYFREHDVEYILEVLSLRPQLIDIEEKFKEVTTVIAHRNRISNPSQGHLTAEEEQHIRTFIKECAPLFVRMTENANKLAHDGEIKRRLLKNKINEVREKNNRNELFLSLFTIGTALAIICLIFRQIVSTQQAQQKMLFEYQLTKENLEESNQKIISLNEHLEDEVTARTMELTSANRTLTEEIAVRRKTEEELHESKATWERTFDSITDVVTVFDPSLKIVRANSMANTFFPFADGVEGHHCYELFHGGEEPCLDCPILKKNSEFRPYIKEMYNEKLQKTFLLSAAPILDEAGNLAYITHFAKDITDIKEAMDEVRRQKEYIEDIFNLVPQGLITVDKQKKPIEWNLSFDTIITHRAKEIKLSETEVREELVKQLRHELTANDNGLFFLNLNNHHLHFEYFSDEIPSSEKIDRVVSLRDLTEITTMERQLAQAQKLESVGQLAAGIAHEINTPMQYVQNNVTFLKRAYKDLNVLLTDYQQLLDRTDVPMTDESRDHLENISLEFLMEEIPESIDDAQDGINRVVKIVSAMKEFSHPGTDEKIATDLNSALESTITVSRNEWKYVAEMVTDFDPNLPMVPCLPDQLNQVVLNLIINGAHAIAETGASVPDNPGTITISTRGDDDWVELRVSDTGNGIPKEIRARVFDPFFTTKEVGKGTGQGLAIIHDVVKKHGGKIDFITEDGKGTTFIVRLPITSENDEGIV